LNLEGAMVGKAFMLP